MGSRTVLVTGATGFVGPHLIRRLVRQGDEVWALVRRRADAGVSKRLFQLGLSDLVKVVEGDITNLTSMISAVSQILPDAIFHLAAQSFVPRSFADPHETFITNTLGTETLLEAMRLKDLKSRLVFAGTSEEYGFQVASKAHYNWYMKRYRTIAPSPIRIPELPIDETNFLRPMSPYAASKVGAEEFVKEYTHSFGIEGIPVRAFNHEGPGRGHDFVTTTIVRQAVAMKQGELKSIVLGNVNAARDWSHVSDIVAGYDLLSRRGTPGEPYVLGSRRTNTVLAYLLLTLDRLGFDASRVSTLNGRKVVIDPIEKLAASKLGISLRIDESILLGRNEFSLSDRGLLIGGGSNKVKLMFDETKFRPTEVPILLSNPEKAVSLGFKPLGTIDRIIADQIDYFLDPSNRRP